MKRFMGMLVVLALGTSLLAGCVAAPISKDSIAQIQKGVSTKDDVKELLGEPDSETIHDDQTSVWIYSRRQSGSAGIPIGNLFAIGQAQVNYQNVVIKFDSQDVVKSITQNYGHSTATAISR